MSINSNVKRCHKSLLNESGVIIQPVQMFL